MNLDLYIFQEINNFALKYLWLDTIGIFFAKYFGYLLIFFLILFLVKNFKKYKLMICQAFLAGILARIGIVELIRFIFPIPRPFVKNNIHLLLDHINTPGFPSGHAAFYFAISTILYFYNKKAGLLFFLASFLISISRVFSGLHWPSDILGGMAVGILSGWLIIKIFKR